MQLHGNADEMELKRQSEGMELFAVFLQFSSCHTSWNQDLFKMTPTHRMNHDLLWL